MEFILLEVILRNFFLKDLILCRWFQDVEHSIISCIKFCIIYMIALIYISKISLRVARPNSRTKSVFYIPTVRTNVGESSPLIQVLRNYSGVEELSDIFVCSIPSIRSCLKRTLANRS
jgi:hypothetical protein